MKRYIRSDTHSTWNETTDRLVAKHILERYSQEQKHYVAECIEEQDQASTEYWLSPELYDEDSMQASLNDIKQEWIDCSVSSGLLTRKQFNEIYDSLLALMK